MFFGWLAKTTLSVFVFVVLLVEFPQASEVVSSLRLNYKSRESAPPCPPLLEKWVDDDFTDKTSWGLDYKSEFKTCQQLIPDQLLNRPLSLAEYFNKKFEKQINSAYKKQLLKCNQLPRQKALAVHTRFYNAGTKIEAVNSSLVDEIAHIDSVLVDIPILNGVECPVILPQIRNKCDAYKNAARSCFIPKQLQLERIVKKTQETIPVIEALILAHQKCLDPFTRGSVGQKNLVLSEKNQKLIKEQCDPILSAIELKKNEIPWVRGADFQKMTVKKMRRLLNGAYTSEYDLSDATVAKAITAQLKQNRKALTETYKSNLENFRCLSSDSVNEGSCDFEKIRTHLQGLPDLRSSSAFTMEPLDREAKAYIESDKCLLERHEDRAQTKKNVDAAVGGIALTVATFGLGESIAGIQLANTSRRLMQLKQGLLVANTSINVAFLGHGLKEAYDSCSVETKSIIEISKTTDLTQENVCTKADSGLEQAKEQESQCVLTALMSVPSVLPFVGAIPSLKALLSKFESAKKIKGSANSISETTKVAASAIAKKPSGSLESLMEGSAEAEAAVKLGEVLRARKIDPRTTHIPEFADKVASHVEFARKSIQVQDTWDQSKRLKILKDFEEEAAARIKSGQVTYEWWNDYNHRLSILMTPANKRTVVAGGRENKFASSLLKKESWQTADGYRTAAAKQENSILSSYEYHDVAAAFPKHVVIPSIEGDIGIAALNSTYGSNTSIIGLMGSKIRADGREMYPDHFYRHDHVHVSNETYINSRYELSATERAQLRSSYLQYRETVPISNDRRQAFEFSYFIVTHELPGVDSILREGGIFHD